jgi:hypothetical protein
MTLPEMVEHFRTAEGGTSLRESSQNTQMRERMAWILWNGYVINIGAMEKLEHMASATVPMCR